MFRPQRITKDVGYFEPFLQSVEEVDGECVTVTHSQLGTLPPEENFDLKTLLAAKENLEKVPTRLIDSGAIPQELFAEESEKEPDNKPDDKE